MGFQVGAVFIRSQNTAVRIKKASSVKSIVCVFGFLYFFTLTIFLKSRQAKDTIFCINFFYQKLPYQYQNLFLFITLKITSNYILNFISQGSCISFTKKEKKLIEFVFIVLWFLGLYKQGLSTSTGFKTCYHDHFSMLNTRTLSEQRNMT